MRILPSELLDRQRVEHNAHHAGTAQGRSLSNEKPTDLGRLVKFSIVGSAFRQVVRWSRPAGMGAAYCLPVFDRKGHALYNRRVGAVRERSKEHIQFDMQ
jgi:hypothetical protein